MNGQSVSERTQIHHGARVLLGNHHLYRLSCPRQAGENTETVELMDYEQAMKEISLKELDKGNTTPWLTTPGDIVKRQIYAWDLFM